MFQSVYLLFIHDKHKIYFAVQGKITMLTSTEKIREMLEDEGAIITSDDMNNVGLHSHKFIELVYIMRGSVKHFRKKADDAAGHEDILRAGDYFVIDSGVSHSYSSIDNNPFLLINCMFIPKFIDSGLSDDTSLGSIIDSFIIHYTEDWIECEPSDMIFRDISGEIGAMMKMLLREYETKKTAYSEMMRNYLTNILLQMMRQVITQRPDNDNLICGRVKNYISRHFGEDITLEIIAEQLNYTAPYLSKLFHTQSGMTFKDYIRRYRITAAENLLRTTSSGIDVIALKCGYSDTDYFRRVFRKLTGMTPREYREKSASCG